MIGRCVYIFQSGSWHTEKGPSPSPRHPPPPSFPHITSPYRVYLGPLLGEGGFAFVYACTDVQDESRRLVLKKLIVQDQAHNV